MAVTLKTVGTRSDLKKFIEFPYSLYSGCENWVPALEGDEYDTLDPKKNAAFEYCDAQCYLAYKDGKIAGRVAAIINRNANRQWGEKVVRFGWLDFIEDVEVLKALIDEVARWGAERGCTCIKGPLGFTDMDKEGLLVEGFEHISPFTCLYNYPYYGKMLEELGFSKDVDWTQRVVNLGDEQPPMFQFADKIEERFGVKVALCRNSRELRKRYGLSIFHMYNETFAPLFQFTPLSDKQIERYLDTYVPILSEKFIAVAVNEKDEPVGFAFCVPSLSRAVKKSGGRLFPFGFIRILRALKRNDTLEALMIGVLPEYQGKGTTVQMFRYLDGNCRKYGIKRLILNPQLEENFKVQSLFEQYETEPYMRRRSYMKNI